MAEEIYEVGMGEYMVANDPITLVSKGVGSCIVISLYDRTSKIGAMAHAMLPKKTSLKSNNECKYIDIVIPKMIDELRKLGVDTKNLIAKLAGGANMFNGENQFASSIGDDNISHAVEILNDFDIPIDGESVGGTSGRNVEFNLTNGIMAIVSKI